MHLLALCLKIWGRSTRRRRWLKEDNLAIQPIKGKPFWLWSEFEHHSKWLVPLTFTHVAKKKHSRIFDEKTCFQPLFETFQTPAMVTYILHYFAEGDVLLTSAKQSCTGVDGVPAAESGRTAAAAASAARVADGGGAVRKAQVMGRDLDQRNGDVWWFFS